MKENAILSHRHSVIKEFVVVIQAVGQVQNIYTISFCQILPHKEHIKEKIMNIWETINICQLGVYPIIKI